MNTPEEHLDLFPRVLPEVFRPHFKRLPHVPRLLAEPLPHVNAANPVFGMPDTGKVIQKPNGNLSFLPRFLECVDGAPGSGAAADCASDDLVAGGAAGEVGAGADAGVREFHLHRLPRLGLVTPGHRAPVQHWSWRMITNQVLFCVSTYWQDDILSPVGLK